MMFLGSSWSTRALGRAFDPANAGTTFKGAGLDVAGPRDISDARREITMFECWVYKDEPHLRLVVKQGAMLPTELGHKDWKLLGPWEADADTSHEVEHRGFHFFKTAEPYDGSSLKNAEASGN